MTDELVVSRKELWGWYAYAIASEPYSLICIGVLFPILLQSMATQAGKLLDRTTPCDPANTDVNRCVIPIGNWWVDTSSFPLYITSLSVFIQLFLFCSIASHADHGNRRKYFLLGFGTVGALFCTLGFTFLDASLYWWAATVYIVCNVTFGASYVFYFAYIPILTRYLPNVCLVHEIGTEQEIHETVDREGNRMSAIGMSVGYGVSMVLLIVIALIVLAMGSDKDYPLAIGIGIVGVWWLVWNLVPLRWLEYRPGPPFPKDVNAITYSWKQIGFTLYRVSKLSHAFKVLLAWLLISDAITTLSSVAILFGRDNLKMPQFQLLIAAILLPLSAMIGSYGWYLIQRRLNLTTRTMIILLSFLYALLPVYGLLGFVAPIGLKNVWEVWMVVVYDGLMLGAIQSFFRVQFSQLLPRTVESELFALYEVTDKGSSWIGGLFAAAITDWTHDLRNTFWLLLVMFLLPIVLIWFVDVKEGKQQAIDFYKVKRGNREA